MVKRAFTLIELIVVIVILGLISIGSFNMLKGMFERYYQSGIITDFSVSSQALLDESSYILYYRIPLTVIGYNPDNGDFKRIQDIDTDDYSVFEWIAEAYDVKKHIIYDIHKGFSGFIDLDASDRDTLTLVAKDFNLTDVNKTENSIFDKNEDLNKTVAIIFAGRFDKGDESANDDYNNSYGYHGNEHKKVFMVKSFKQVDNDTNMTMNDDIKGNKVYAKYYLADSAYAISRGERLNTDADCIKNLDIPNDEVNNTLFLFYDYRPWEKETFCADPNGSGQSGKVSILSKDVTAFRVRAVGYHLELKVQLEKPIYKGSDKNITIAKQKVAF
jgi:prepilin-type N-terminal cleavage/methylation domain-containing protein